MMVLPAAVDIFVIEFFSYHFCERDKKKRWLRLQKLLLN